MERISRISLFLMVFLSGFMASAQTGGPVSIPTEKISWERLPDLNTPRAGHIIICPRGEITVIGGHTTGFVPTSTAEYYHEGKWHQIPAIYTHDNAFSLTLKSGNTIVGGGSEESFGIGQTFSTEIYDPKTHSFEPLPILDRRRTMASALELSDGTVLVSGNWYAEDALEEYDSENGFTYVKDVTEMRSTPWILQTAPDNAIIFSRSDPWDTLSEGIVDRYKGESFQVPLLTEWRPLRSGSTTEIDSFFIGDETRGDYSYLIPAIRDGQMNVLLVRGEDISLLEMETELPSEGPWGDISYNADLMVDRERKIAWLPGSDTSKRAILIRIDYEAALKGGKASLTLYYTDPLEDLPLYSWTSLLPDGRIALAGGLDNSNYTPYASAYILSPFEEGGMSARLKGIITGIISCLILIGISYLISRRFRKKPDSPAAPDEAEKAAAKEDTRNARDKEIFEKVSSLMENEELFRKKGLTIADLATRLGTNTKYISSSISAGAESSFYDYVNGYRIRYIQKVISEHPESRLSDVADAAGFSSETAFYRNFKALTGQTPSEWISSRKEE